MQSDLQPGAIKLNMNDPSNRTSTLSASEAANNSKSVPLFALASIWNVEYSVLAVMLVSLSLIGIVGNISVLIVYFRRRENLASNTFIKVLAFIDLLVCLFVSSYSIVYELHLVTSDIICRCCEVMRHFCIFASNITLIAIASERYIAVCHLSFKLNVNSINVGVWVIFGLSIVLAAPVVGTFAVVHDSEVRNIECRFPHELTSGTFCHFTYSVMGKSLVTAYQVAQVVLFFVTVLIITVLYSIIYITLWTKSKLRRKMLNRNKWAQETESTSDVSYVRSRNEPSISSANYSRISLSSVTNLKDQVDCEFSKESSIQPQSQPIPAFHLNKEGKFKIDSASKRSTKGRRKIKFSVSAQTGRSERIKRKQYYHKPTAKMLFLCTVIFIVSWLPFWIDVFGLTNSLIIRYLFFIGNATNPIVYGIVNEQVRRAFKQLFFDCLRK